MQLSAAVVLITGGAGPLGHAIASELLTGAASVLLVDDDPSALQAAERVLMQHGERLGLLAADLTLPADRARIRRVAEQWRGGINVLINAGSLDPQRAKTEPAGARWEAGMRGPVALCRSLLPRLRSRPASIVNVGSVSGGLGSPDDLTQTAMKLALRAFTAGLRRELAGTPVSVHYIAPRGGSGGTARGHLSATHGATDPSQRLARAVRTMLERDHGTTRGAWPMKLLARVASLRG